ELGAHVLEGVLQLDLLGDRNAIVRHVRGAELLVQRHVAATWSQRRLDRVRHRVNPFAQRSARFFTEFQLLRRHWISFLISLTRSWRSGLSRLSWRVSLGHDGEDVRFAKDQ